MNDYKYLKALEHEGLNLRIEFCLINEHYIGHKIYKNGHIVPVKSLNLIES